MIPFGRIVDRAVFITAELLWIDEEVRRIATAPDLWVPALMAHHEAHRTMTLSVSKLARGSVGPLGVRLGYPLRAAFLARWNVYEMLWRHYLANKMVLAAQLQARPYEAEVLRKSRYFGAAISGIQVEFNRTGSAPTVAEATKICPYCAETIKAMAVICRYCNREHPEGDHGIPAETKIADSNAQRVEGPVALATPTPTAASAGWFPDPQGPGQLRFFDGEAWTSHTAPA